MRQRIPLILFTLFIVAACFTYYAASDCIHFADVCFQTNSPVDALQMAPYKYRVIDQPLLHLFGNSEQNVILTAVVIQAALNGLIIPLLYYWLRRWLTTEHALIGLMIYALTNISAYHLWFLNINILIELACIMLTLALIERHWLWIVPIAVLSAANRETGLVIAGIYAAYHGRKNIKVSIALVAIWAVIQAAIHLAVGSYPHVLGSVAGGLAYNLNNLPQALFVNTILMPLAIATTANYRFVPLQLKRLFWVASIYLLAIIVGGSWSEILRLCLPFLPLILPTLLLDKSRQFSANLV